MIDTRINKEMEIFYDKLQKTLNESEQYEDINLLIENILLEALIVRGDAKLMGRSYTLPEGISDSTLDLFTEIFNDEGLEDIPEFGAL